MTESVREISADAENIKTDCTGFGHIHFKNQLTTDLAPAPDDSIGQVRSNIK